MSRARDRVDTALSRLESMVDERLRAEMARAEDLAGRLATLERQHDELKKVATEVEERLERAMEYIRSLLAADQKGSACDLSLGRCFAQADVSD